VITDQLDVAKLDLTTFSLGAMVFSDTVVTPPAGRAAYTTEVDLRPARNLLVDISAALNPATGIVTWNFTSIDPATKALPEDPWLGFLPPDVHSPEGQGSVFYTISPKAGLTTSTQITNQATIVFDLKRSSFDPSVAEYPGCRPPLQQPESFVGH